MKRRFARDWQSLKRQTRRLPVREEPGFRSTKGQSVPGDLPREALERAIKHVVGRKAGAHARRGIKVQRLGLAQRKQAQAMIEVAIGDHDARERSVTQWARVKTREAF